MTLEVIGVGLGRTGTTSLKSALERIGFAPCYSFPFGRPNDFDVWGRAAAGDVVEWADLFSRFRAAVDWPTCAFWRELADAYPAAKFVLTERDPDSWWDSFAAALLPGLGRDRSSLDSSGTYPAVLAVVRRSLGDALGDREAVIAAYRRHNQDVREGIAPHRLLVTSVDGSWEPLCGFLGVPVPAEPFPKMNERVSPELMASWLNTVSESTTTRAHDGTGLSGADNQ